MAPVRDGDYCEGHGIFRCHAANERGIFVLSDEFEVCDLLEEASKLGEERSGFHGAVSRGREGPYRNCT